MTKYLDIYLDTPFGCGVARLVVNDYAHFVYTSNATEIAAIEKLVKKKGLSYREAILKIVRRKQKHRREGGKRKKDDRS